MERLRLVNRRTGGRFEEHRESLRESPKQSLGSSLVTGSPGRFDLAAQPDDNTTGDKGTLCIYISSLFIIITIYYNNILISTFQLHLRLPTLVAHLPRS